MNLSRGNIAVIIISDYEFFISWEFLSDFIIELVIFGRIIAVFVENIFNLFNVHADKSILAFDIVNHVLTAVIIFGVIPDLLIKGLIFLGSNNGVSYAESRNNTYYKDKRNYSDDKPFLFKENCNASAKIRCNKNNRSKVFTEMTVFP